MATIPYSYAALRTWRLFTAATMPMLVMPTSETKSVKLKRSPLTIAPMDARPQAIAMNRRNRISGSVVCFA